jgi:hypothetical protein
MRVVKISSAQTPNGISDEKKNEFLAHFGLGPNYVLKPRQKHKCIECGGQNAYYREEHQDCDGGQNENILYCPDCKLKTATQKK